jgi:DNA-binding NarL/FixJ family response regulator
MRVLIYSPVRLFGECMAAVLTSTEIVDAVLTEHDAVDLDLKVMEFGADVALFDVTASESSAAAHMVKGLCPDVSMVAVAVTEVAAEVIACAESGFDAYVPRTARTTEMLEILQRARQGETICDPKIARMLFNELARRPGAGVSAPQEERLTAREIEIARLLGRGVSNKEIAAELHLSVATIKNHVHSVLHKLQVGSRGQVASLLRENPLALRLPRA